MTTPNQVVSRNAEGPLRDLWELGHAVTRNFNDTFQQLSTQLPMVENINNVNNALVETGHGSLVIGERQVIAPIRPADDIIRARGGQFARRFRMATNFKKETPVPITEAELLGLVEGTFTTDKIKNGLTHAQKEAFIRMLALFPTSTVKLVTDLSQPENHAKTDLFIPQLVAGYAIMSQLVDKNDRGGLLPHQEMDEAYLTRR